MSNTMWLHKLCPVCSHCCPTSCNKANICCVNLLGTSTVPELVAAQGLFWPEMICSAKWICVARERVWLHHVGEDGQGAVIWLVAVKLQCY